MDHLTVKSKQCNNLVFLFVLKVLGRLPVCDHQSQPLPGGPLGGLIQRYVALSALESKLLFCDLIVVMLKNVLSFLDRVDAGVSATWGSDQLWGRVSHPGQRLLCPAAALSDQKHEWTRPAQLACWELLQEVPLSLQEEYVLILFSIRKCIQCLSWTMSWCCIFPTGQTCVDIKDNVVNEGYYFTPKGDDPCLSCTCHDGEPEMCVAALCERPQGCQHFRKDPKECCKFTCLDPGTATLAEDLC